MATVLSVETSFLQKPTKIKSLQFYHKAVWKSSAKPQKWETSENIGSKLMMRSMDERANCFGFSSTKDGTLAIHQKSAWSEQKDRLGLDKQTNKQTDGKF